MPSLWSAIATVGDEPDNTALRSIRWVGRSVIALSLWLAAPRAGLAPFAQETTQRRAAQSLLSPCCHLRRCSPNQEIMIAARRNGIMALEIAAPSPSWPAMIARW